MSKSKSIFHELGDAILLGTDGVNLGNTLLGGGNPLLFKYINVACGRFIWDNLPEGLESRDIELRLLVGGYVFFTETKKYGKICLSATPVDYNIYNKPVKVRVNGFGYDEEFSVKDGVLISDNLTPEYPAFFQICKAVHLLNEIDDTIHMNLGQQKFPVIIPKTSNTELSIKQFGEDVFNSYFPMQFVDKRMEKALGEHLESMKVLKTEVPYLLDKLQEFRQMKESEILSYLGINNISIFKKERLISDEANSNNDFIKMNLEICYQRRLEACRKINEKYGTNITVTKYTELLPEEVEEYDLQDKQE